MYRFYNDKDEELQLCETCLLAQFEIVEESL